MSAAPATNLRGQWTAYLDGRFVPDQDALISHRDRGFRWGDSAFDTMRTFGREIFRLEQHLLRLKDSLEYINIDCPGSVEELSQVLTSLVERNAEMLAPADDFWVTLRISAGNDAPPRPEHAARQAVTIVGSCDPLPFPRFAHQYAEGVDLISVSTRRVPPECVDPGAKLGNYLNHKLADLQAQAASRQARPLMLDVQGFIAESSGANYFLAKNGRILTPPLGQILPGVSREVTIQLARAVGLEVLERPLTLRDAYTADEAFITATSFCILPVATHDGRPVQSCPGPVVNQLTDQWAALVGIDLVEQARTYARTEHDEKRK